MLSADLTLHLSDATRTLLLFMDCVSGWPLLSWARNITLEKTVSIFPSVFKSIYFDSAWEDKVTGPNP